MSKATSTALIVELEGAMKGGSPERRLQMLRQKENPLAGQVVAKRSQPAEWS